MLFDDGLPTVEQAYDLLLPHLGRITGCLDAGFKAWDGLQERSPEECVPLTSCTIAGIIQNHMVRHARLVFRGLEPDVLLMEEAGFLVVDFGQVKMRFKKLSTRLRPYNVQTNQQQACEDQTLFGVGATLVTAGYRLTPLGTFKDAHVVCWIGPELRWSFRLPDTGGTTEPVAVPMGEGPRAPVLVPKPSPEIGIEQAM